MLFLSVFCVCNPANQPHSQKNKPFKDLKKKKLSVPINNQTIVTVIVDEMAARITKAQTSSYSCSPDKLDVSNSMTTYNAAEIQIVIHGNSRTHLIPLSAFALRFVCLQLCSQIMQNKVFQWLLPTTAFTSNS